MGDGPSLPQLGGLRESASQVAPGQEEVNGVVTHLIEETAEEREYQEVCIAKQEQPKPISDSWQENKSTYLIAKNSVVQDSHLLPVYAKRANMKKRQSALKIIQECVEQVAGDNGRSGNGSKWERHLWSSYFVLPSLIGLISPVVSM